MTMFKINQCVMCGCKDVPSQMLDIPVNIHGLVSVRVQGAKCVSCGEEYYDMRDTRAIEALERSAKEQAVSSL